MLEYLITGIVCLILGAGITYLLLRSRLKVTQQLDQATALKNKQLQEEKHSLNLTIVELAARQSELKNSIQSLQEYADEYYNKNLELATERLNTSLEQAAKKYQDDEAAYEKEYLKTIQEYANEFAETFVQKQEELKQLQDTITDLRQTVTAAVEANKRHLEEQTQQDFYRLQLPSSDINEIKKLREVVPYLRDKEALNKVIYKVYYEKPYTDLIGRVVGSRTKTGIYKLTNIKNGMCYVGQAVDIADRWKTHIKRGLGAEPGGRNKLYPIMYEIGPENFTFEVIEECSRDQLNSREDYWQDYFKAKEFGYSIK